MSHKEDGGGYSQNKYNSFKKVLIEALEFLGAIHLYNQTLLFIKPSHQQVSLL